MFLLTFHKESPNFFPEVWIIVKCDAFLMHTNTLQAKFAAELGDVLVCFIT
jgi:hypothetical protein